MYRARASPHFKADFRTIEFPFFICPIQSEPYIPPQRTATESGNWISLNGWPVTGLKDENNNEAADKPVTCKNLLLCTEGIY
jgi:hypothetical protein